MNAKLEIRHNMGAEWRPQCQGMAENLVKMATNVMRVFVHNHDGYWQCYIPAVEGAMRAMPMEALPNRCPTEVVMGLTPKLPQTLAGDIPAERMGVENYVVQLAEELARCTTT